ncbi:nlpa lipoprotein [Lasius niger]|uniref:Nlpa lipoprotein n=1 Tax=Lasius niger TaxID=67767 RepID=A0A0J7JW41_LASNI|nr:nlpa lipoprotein [Lasius niger]
MPFYLLSLHGEIIMKFKLGNILPIAGVACLLSVGLLAGCSSENEQEGISRMMGSGNQEQPYADTEQGAKMQYNQQQQLKKQQAATAKTTVPPSAS